MAETKHSTGKIDRQKIAFIPGLLILYFEQLGTGRMGAKLAEIYAGVGHTVLVGSRTESKAKVIFVNF
jgi:hypothetical protein